MPQNIWFQNRTKKLSTILKISDRHLIAIQEDVLKSSILLHDKRDIKGVETLIANVKDKCQCEVENLSHVQALVLHYPNSSHDPADSFLQIKGVVKAAEDDIVLPPEDISIDSINFEVKC